MTAPGWLVAQPIAHRGLHDRANGVIENTISAAEAAIGGGFAIECDVQLSADGEAMVFHDHALDRLTRETGPVRDRTAAELGRLPLRGTADTIATLPDFLARIGGRAPLVVEIKSRFDGDERLARRAAAILAGSPHPVAVKSFDPAIVSLVRRIAPETPRGIVAQSSYEGAEWDRLYEERRRAMAQLLHWTETEPDFLSWRHVDLPNASTFLPRVLARVPVTTWTIRSPAEATRALAHADQIVFEGFRPA